MAYIDIDLDQFDDDEIIDEFISRWNSMRIGEKFKKKAKAEFTELTAESELNFIHADLSKLSVMDEFKLRILNDAFKKYTLAELEEIFNKQTV